MTGSSSNLAIGDVAVPLCCSSYGGGAGTSLDFRRRKSQNNAAAKSMSPATPPITPPIIAPVSLDLLGLGKGLRVGVVIESMDAVAIEVAEVEEVDVDDDEDEIVLGLDAVLFGLTLVSSPFLSIQTPLPESQHDVAFTPQQ